MSGAPIRVLIVDDQRLVRSGIRAILEDESDMEVVGEAGDGSHAANIVDEVRPDVVLMDIRMPGVDGLEGTRRILARSATRVIILTTFDADEYVYDALRAGASGFLLKDSPAGQLVASIRAAAAGDAAIDPTVTRRLLDRFASAARPPNRSPASLSKLTPRELEVLRLICRGLSNPEIAAELYVEETTVKTHVGRILTKLGLRDRVQAVILGYESGLVTP